MIAAIDLYRAVSVIIDLFLAALVLYAVAYLLRWALTATLRLFARKVAGLDEDGEPLTEHEEWVLEGIAEASADAERETS